MRKILIVIGCIIAASQSFAQTIKFDAVAGVNSSVYSEKESAYGKAIGGYTYSVTDSHITGFHAGALITLSHGNFDLQSGLIYTKKGGDDIAVVSPAPGVVERDYGHIALSYINLPLNITYNVKLRGCKIFLGGGPYMETGLAGTYTANYIGYNQSNVTTGTRRFGVGFGGSTTSPSFGIGLLGGVHLNNSFTLSTGYEFGLTNEAYNPIFIAKNNAFKVSVAYTLFKLNQHRRKTA